MAYSSRMNNDTHTTEAHPDLRFTRLEAGRYEARTGSGPFERYQIVRLEPLGRYSGWALDCPGEYGESTTHSTKRDAVARAQRHYRLRSAE